MIWLLRLALDPRFASHLGAALAGDPELGSALERVCEREAPRCRLVGVHERDRWMHRRAWLAAVRVGWLDPGRCEWHELEAAAWSTSGPWGMVRAYSLHHLGCAPAWLLDLPIVGAFVAARRASSPRCASVARCRSWASHGDR